MKTLFILCLLAATAHGRLKWDRKEVELKVHPTQLSADAVFRFSNVGKKSVTVTDMKIGCGCLAPKLNKKTYAPGESGELKIRFDLRKRTGKQRKPTHVKTSDGKTVALYSTVDIPTAYKIAPIMMKWAKGNTAKTKTATLVNPNKMPIKVISVSSSHKNLPVQLMTVREGFEYEVVVTKLPAASNARSVVRITVEPPPGQKEGKTLKFYVHAQ